MTLESLQVILSLLEDVLGWLNKSDGFCYLNGFEGMQTSRGENFFCYALFPQLYRGFEG
jgi:hypothetical protein